MKDKLGTAMLIGVLIVIGMFVVTGYVIIMQPTEQNCIADCNVAGLEYDMFHPNDRFSEAFCRCLNESTIVEIPTR